MDLYAVRDTPDITEAKTRLGITKTPTLVVLRPGRSEAEAYKGTRFNFGDSPLLTVTHRR